MKGKVFKKAIIVLAILLIIYFFPFGIISMKGRSSIIATVSKLPDADAVIIFGTLVNDSGDITPLLRERLEAGKRILEEAKSNKIVVSNTKDAANIMATYLYNHDVPSNLVEIDIQADTTPDTCSYEKEMYPEKRKVIFVSQEFHLPRLLYQCKKIGVEGIAFPADALNTIDRSKYSLFTKIHSRTKRYIREAGLTWLVFLNIY